MVSLKKYLAISALSLTIFSQARAGFGELVGLLGVAAIGYATYADRVITTNRQLGQEQRRQRDIVERNAAFEKKFIPKEAKECIEKAQEDYKKGIYDTHAIPYPEKDSSVNFSNIVCDGDRAIATLTHRPHLPYWTHRDDNGALTSEYGSRLREHQLSSCSEYFKLMVAIRNDEVMKKRIEDSRASYDILESVPEKDRGNLFHMIINNNINIDMTKYLKRK
jgi:hypothetical protein